ncbi:uncharacterized protein IUM83_06909 [Phytophthora cinnamomi]|uniref:uncharacterized protein n=1 Tax=Phytophthora cinnamomi TaxID=4785 RepID=UPI00355AB365|nr:hypothetical protein IUM83_06909 [Phytophthora cinnamomi]
MFKLLAATIAVVAITVGGTRSGEVAVAVKSLRVQEQRLLEVSGSGSSSFAAGGGDAGDSLYEKCKWYDHFKFWSCCGWSCS